MFCDYPRVLGHDSFDIPAQVQRQDRGRDPNSHIPLERFVVVGWYGLAVSQGKLSQFRKLGPYWWLDLGNARSLDFPCRSIGSPRPIIQILGRAGANPKYQQKVHSRRQAPMVPRHARMLLDSASAKLRSCLLVVCGAAALGCGPNSSANHPQQQRSDLLPAPRQNNATRGWIGILVAGVADSGSGIQVMGVVPDSPAASAGIAAGDLLLGTNERTFDGPDALVALIRSSAPGSVLRFKGRRTGATRTFEVSVEPAPDENTVLERIFVGRPAPSLDGVVGVSDAAAPSWLQLRGRVVVLDFWAPWCGVCHVVADDLNRWQHEFGKRLQVVGIAAGTVEDVSRLAPQFHMEYLVAADPSEAVSTAFSASAVPLVVVVDAAGVVRAITLGYSSARMSAMKNIVAQLVSQQ